jgi:hypothetical protein
MTDIDFDELDKAVTNLMGKVEGADKKNPKPVDSSDGAQPPRPTPVATGGTNTDQSQSRNSQPAPPEAPGASSAPTVNQPIAPQQKTGEADVTQHVGMPGQRIDSVQANAGGELNAQSSAAAEQPATATSATPAGEQTAQSPEPESQKASAPTPTRRGQYMDVMSSGPNSRGPSPAGSETPTTQTTASEHSQAAGHPMSRQGVKLEPLSDVVIPPAEVSSPTVRQVLPDIEIEPSSQPSQNKQSVAISEVSPPDSAHPLSPAGSSRDESVDQPSDILDHSDNSQASTKSVDDHDEVHGVAHSTVSDPEAQMAAPQTVGTPFLPDTKIEKRPLGQTTAQSSEETTQATPQAAQVTTRSNSDNMTESQTGTQEGSSTAGTQVQPTNTVPVHTAALPPELNKELMQVESDTTLSGESEAGQSDKDAHPPLESTHPAVESSAESAQESKATTSEDVAKPTLMQRANQEQDANNGVTAGEALTSGAPERSMYDTDHEVKAPASPPKKSAVKTVLIILVLVTVGASAGALLYFLQNGM